MIIKLECFVIVFLSVSLFSCLSLSLSSNNNIAVESSINKIPSISHINDDNTYLYNSISTHSVTRQSCTSNMDCTANNTYCHSDQHICKCKSDFVPIGSFMNKTLNHQLIPVCLPVAKLDERCYSHEQCVVTNTACVFVDPGVGSFRNVSSHYCKCKEGYHQEDKEELIRIYDQMITNHPICGEFLSIGNSWVGTFAIVCIILLILLIGCFIGIVRFQHWKQRPLASTLTSFAATSGGHTPHLISSSPPPMGSYCNIKSASEQKYMKLSYTIKQFIEQGFKTEPFIFLFKHK